MCRVRFEGAGPVDVTERSGMTSGRREELHTPDFVCAHIPYALVVYIPYLSFLPSRQRNRVPRGDW